jgi:hypothetical protein
MAVGTLRPVVAADVRTRAPLLTADHHRRRAVRLRKVGAHELAQAHEHLAEMIEHRERRATRAKPIATTTTIQVTERPPALDITGAATIEITIDADGRTLWLDADGANRVRCAGVARLVISDQRKPEL